MNLKSKLFWNVEHYKIHVPTGKEINISAIKGMPVRIAQRLKLKAQRNGYRYNCRTHEYICTKGDFEYHLAFASI